jgi:hypothetical protein
MAGTMTWRTAALAPGSGAFNAAVTGNDAGVMTIGGTVGF